VTDRTAWHRLDVAPLSARPDVVLNLARAQGDDSDFFGSRNVVECQGFCVQCSRVPVSVRDRYVTRAAECLLASEQLSEHSGRQAMLHMAAAYISRAIELELRPARSKRLPSIFGPSLVGPFLPPRDHL
jgi:hypothetical protein